MGGDGSVNNPYAAFTYPLKVEQIQQVIPHRYPFLFLDEVTKFVENEGIWGKKNVTVNEPFFQGHFPGRPIMPGVVILEALAQLGAIYAKFSLAALGRGTDSLIVFAGVDEVRFRRLVRPGDTLDMSLLMEKQRGAIWRMKGTATVAGEIVCDGTLMASEVK